MPLDLDNVDSLYDARSLLECNLLAMGAPRASPEAVDHLRHMVREGYRLVDDPVAFRVLDLEFHQTLNALAGNPFLERMAQSLYHIGTEFRRVASETPGVLRQSAAEHEAIVDAIERGSGEASAEKMRLHLASIRKTTRDAMAGRAREA
jgi:GntR family transcriptional repressor for pyruvate dehydrogenase complex